MPLGCPLSKMPQGISFAIDDMNRGAFQFHVGNLSHDRFDLIKMFCDEFRTFPHRVNQSFVRAKLHRDWSNRSSTGCIDR